MKKRGKRTRLSDVHQHPPCPRATKANNRQGRDHQETTLYTAAAQGNRRHPCGQSERTRKYSLLGAEDMQSSTRVDSMALLGTKARDEYYRNDSPVETRWLAAAEKPERPSLGVHILKYCRREEEKKKKKPKRNGELDGNL